MLWVMLWVLGMIRMLFMLLIQVRRAPARCEAPGAAMRCMPLEHPTLGLGLTKQQQVEVAAMLPKAAKQTSKLQLRGKEQGYALTTWLTCTLQLCQGGGGHSSRALQKGHKVRQPDL
jgi:hypothetical protein